MASANSLDLRPATAMASVRTSGATVPRLVLRDRMAATAVAGSSAAANSSAASQTWTLVKGL
jgi:hypothetical protein